MKVDVTQEGAATIVYPQGAMIAGELDELDGTLKRLCDAWAKRIILNMTDAALVDSAGLELICTYEQLLNEQGLRLKICSLNDMVQKIFELTRLARRFEIYNDTSAAVRSYL